MEFTFGIITDGNNQSRIGDIIDSIESMEIESYEVLVVGGHLINRKNTRIEHLTKLQILKI